MIVQKDKDELLVDVGGKSEGVLPFRELSLAIDHKLLKVGDTLEVMFTGSTSSTAPCSCPNVARARSRRGKRSSKRTNTTK